MRSSAFLQSPNKWFSLAVVGMLAAGSAMSAPAAPGSFLYCHMAGNDIAVFAGKPAPDGSLEFGLSLWQGTRNVGVFGTATRHGRQWEYQDNMDAGTAQERCRLDIVRNADGTFQVTADPDATCQSLGGQGTAVGTVRFPATTYEGPVTNELDADQNFDNAGRCWRKSEL